MQRGQPGSLPHEVGVCAIRNELSAYLRASEHGALFLAVAVSFEAAEQQRSETFRVCVRHELLHDCGLLKGLSFLQNKVDYVQVALLASKVQRSVLVAVFEKQQRFLDVGNCLLGFAPGYVDKIGCGMFVSLLERVCVAVTCRVEEHNAEVVFGFRHALLFAANCVL